MFRFLLTMWRDDLGRPDEPVEPVEQTPEVPRNRQRGQSLVEYSILLTWMTLASIAIIHGISGSTKQAWTTANNDLSQAQSVSH